MKVNPQYLVRKGIFELNESRRRCQHEILKPEYAIKLAARRPSGLTQKICLTYISAINTSVTDIMKKGRKTGTEAYSGRLAAIATYDPGGFLRIVFTGRW
jgi:hypothetical protein